MRESRKPSHNEKAPRVEAGAAGIRFGCFQASWCGRSSAPAEVPIKRQVRRWLALFGCQRADPRSGGIFKLGSRLTGCQASVALGKGSPTSTPTIGRELLSPAGEGKHFHPTMSSTSAEPMISRPAPLLREPERRKLVGLVLVAACVVLPIACGSPPVLPTPSGTAEWPAYGGDVLGSRYSALTEITRDNVAALERAWTFRTGETPEAVPTGSPTAFEATPIVVGGSLYVSTPLGRVFALDPATGAERWRFDAKVDPELEFGDFTNRGVSSWLDRLAGPGAACRRRIFLATIDARLIALDAATGRPCADFGQAGTVNLRRGLRNPPEYSEEYEVTSPPAIVGDLAVVGSGVADNGRADAASGEVRAFDARTGELRWTWDPVPADSSDPGWRTWLSAAAHRTGAANAWSVIAADPERDLVFVPTGSPSPDYYGGERLGADLYANSLVALRASTGERVWHFQVVHHDLWDYDVASPPLLTSLHRGGRDVSVVLQATKTAQLYVLDRETGEPVFPVEERLVPKSTVPGEEAWPTQPFSSLPLLSPQRFTSDDAWGITPFDRRACKKLMERLRHGWRLHAAFVPGLADRAAQHRRRPLGRCRLRSRAADRRSPGQPRGRLRPGLPARALRRGRGRALRLRVRAHARDALHDAARHAPLAAGPPVHAASVGRPGGRRPRERREALGGLAGHDPRRLRVQDRPPALVQVEDAEPGRGDRLGRRARLRGRRHGRLPARLRHRDRT